jgi:hypothetical protein
MTTPTDLRRFALDCLLWAEDAKDAGQRDALVRLARMWMLTASELDQRAPIPGGALPEPFSDLRAKLN